MTSPPRGNHVLIHARALIAHTTHTPKWVTMDELIARQIKDREAQEVSCEMHKIPFLIVIVF